MAPSTGSLALAAVGEFALLEVVAIEEVGAFLDWNLPKDLFLPFSEQTKTIYVGDFVVVYVYVDKSGRTAATMKVEKHLDKEPTHYHLNQEVELMIASQTDIGFKAIINGRHIGVLYANEVFKGLSIGAKMPGYIKNVREDGKIDLSLQPLGHSGSKDLGEQILELLEAKGGFLPLTEKTPPETIYRMFGVSKKKYKMALGGIYKKRLIQIDDDGIRLPKKLLKK